jgi:ABC-2 type transport system permease protein
VLDLSPFTHLSPLPAGSFNTLAAVVLTLVAAALVAAGLTAYRRRDVV